MTTLLISDLHLEPERPAITALFLAFLEQRARQAEALYILGDLFEAWIGDDDDDDLGRQVAEGLRKLTGSGVPAYFLHGNRDFLLGEHFAAVSGLRLLPESVVINLAGEPVLLLHGDTLCIDDVDYQTFRSQVRDPAWQAQTLALPLTQRRALASQMRETSRQATRQKAMDITDVNREEVNRIMKQHRVEQLIHGHTHRPAIREWTLDSHPMRRAVLGDWYEQGSVLCCDALGWRLESLPLSGA
ncbi:MAG: UDP-2,3-diacylglucosamine diphosphatase [Candidatus Competibacteraceae bacterium]|nr:UDP-2,3-diacylglucosamine diphosphatase [Candidatus Competibacteraceae bacterium]HRY16507.1 UDP-2,3-diacylglucosamine diphosphatase [Candidatus Competibacteraceae bacterium]